MRVNRGREYSVLYRRLRFPSTSLHPLGNIYFRNYQWPDYCGG